MIGTNKKNGTNADNISINIDKINGVFIIGLEVRSVVHCSKTDNFTHG